jgi:glutaredoxin-related protein
MTEYCAQMKFKQKIDEKIKSAEFFKFFFKMESQQIFFFWEDGKKANYLGQPTLAFM